MSVLAGITGVLKGTFQNPKRRTSADDSEGAYWCHDCNERVLDLDVDVDGPPTCPSCGEEMSFERAISSVACAC